MVEISIEPDGNFEKIVLMFESADARMNKEVDDAMIESLALILNNVKNSGRIPKKTGTLSRSITTAKSGYGMNSEGATGTNLPYAAIHEYGGTFTRYSAWGRPTRPYSVTYRERSYLRTPFADSMGDVQDIFTSHVEAALDVA